MRIEWDESFSVGDEKIDSQHKELFSRFNTLIKACDEGNGREETLRMLGYLNGCMAAHFGDEEKLQRQYGFPDVDKHHEKHQDFLKKLEELNDQIRNSGPAPRYVANTIQLVAVWLIDHISRMDAEFARFLSIARK